jgi:type VI secretion system secreted protein Hcp
VAIYMRRHDGVKGEVTARGHENDIELTTLKFNATHPRISYQMNASAQHIDSSLSEVVVTKRLDLSSPDTFLNTLNGKSISELEFFFTRTSGGSIETFLHIRLKQNLLTGYSFSSDEVNFPVETISINYLTIEFIYLGRDASGRPSGQYPVIWDIRAG